jgi:hypothetical protein
MAHAVLHSLGVEAKCIARSNVSGSSADGDCIVKPAPDESEHFERCPACGGWIDLRNLGQVLDHAGPLPHPTDDRLQYRLQ